MNRDPSWKWLPSRPDVRTSEQNIPTRPCMPAMEQLDDRVLLSAAPTADVNLKTTDLKISPQILVSHINGQLELIRDELTALKIAPSELKVGDVAQLKVALLKIDDLFLQIGEQAVLGDGSVSKVRAIDDLWSKIDSAFLKINGIVKDADGGERSFLVPAVSKIHSAADQLKVALTNTDSRFVKIDAAQLKIVLELAKDTLKVDEAALKIGLVDQDRLLKILPAVQHKIEQATQKINDLVGSLDSSLKIEGLLPAIQDTLNFLGSFTKQVPTDGLSSLDTSFAGGVTVDDNTDDLFDA